MEFLWHREAIDEADIAAGFYRDKKPELALRFLNSRDEAMGRIEINPAVYREVEPGIRKCKLRTVPYAAIYRTRSSGSKSLRLCTHASNLDIGEVAPDECTELPQA